jgi:WD40 repeat protein
MLLLFAALACQIGPSPAPTPGPVSIDGVEQLTQDFAFYRDVMWSPRGDWIAARRCPILLGRPECNGSDETIVLIEPDSAESQTLIPTLDAEDVRGGFPIAWSQDGTRLLIGVGRVLTTDEAPIPFLKYSYAAYRIDTGESQMLEDDFYPIGWNPAGTAILVETVRTEAVVSIGWFSFEASEFEEVMREEGQEEFLGPYVVSPNGAILLKTDSNLPESCDKVRRSSLQSVAQFEPFLTLACFPSWSSDGSKLAYASKDSPRSLPSQITIANSDGSDPRPLFPGQQLGEVSFPTWSPDGTQIAFVRSSGGETAIYVADVPEELRP